MGISNSVQAGDALGCSRIDKYINILVYVSIYSEGWFPFLFLFLSERLYFSFPVKALLLLPFPCCCLFSIPCSCMLMCCSPSGCARDPTPPRVARSDISCPAGSGCCASSPASSSPPRKNAGIELKDSHPLDLGAPTAAGEQSFFCTRVELAAMIHGTAERDSSQWAAKSELVFLCFGKEAADCVGNFCPKPALTLLRVPNPAGLGRDQVLLFMYQREPSCQTALTQLYNQSHTFSSPSLYLLLAWANP